jgi:hypothetical protein
VDTTNGAPAQRVVNPTAKRQSKRNRKRPKRLNPATAKLLTADAMIATAVLKQAEHEAAHLAATDTDVMEAIKNIDFDADPTLPALPKDFCGKAINPDTKELAEYRELLKCSTGAEWETGFCNEIGRLFPGIQRYQRYRHLPFHPQR